MVQARRLDEVITKLEDKRSNMKVQCRNKHEWLAENKREMENNYEDQIKNLQEQF